MKLKRVLSAVLALALLAAFGMQGAAAWEAPPAIALSQSGSWQQAEFRWAVPGDAAAFFAGVDDGTVTYQWNIAWLQPGASLFAVNELRQEGLIVLSMLPSHARGLSSYQVSLTVNGQSSEWFDLWLFGDMELQELLAQANRLAQNPNRRYCAEYIAQLQTAIAAAQALYTTDDITPEQFAAQLEQLRALVAAPELALTSNNFVNRFIPSWWRFVDFVATPFRWLQDRAGFVFSMLGQIFTAMLSL